jgi:hypothetical protein
MSTRLLVFFCLSATVCTAQSSSDTLFLVSAKQNAIKNYEKFITSQSRLYLGSEYRMYQPTENEFPYFEVNDWSDATIVSSGEQYDNVSLMYDIQNDKVIIENYLTNKEMELVNEKVDRFSFRDHQFVHLYKNSRSGLKDGFYELAYDGKTKFYIKHEKFIQKKIRDRKIYNYFDEKESYYILKGGIYTSVKSKKSILLLLGDRSLDLKEYISKNKIHFKNHKMAISQIVMFYDTPKN